MPWIVRNQKRLWMGRHIALGPVIVSERETQRTDGELMVYVANDRARHKFNANILRTRIIPNGITADECAEVLKIFDLPVGERHKKYLSDIGHQGAELRESNSPYVREAHCWRCKNAIDSEVNLECSKCSWIVCHCGACGCGPNSSSF
jgi:hypothetical protein